MTVTAMPGNDTDEAEAKPRRRWVRFAIIGVVLLIILGGGAYLFLKPKGAKTPAKVELGIIQQVTATQVNLAEGHYLRIGIGMQLTKKAATDTSEGGTDAGVDTSKALDALISVYSGLPIEQVDQATTREQLKQKLADDLKQIYNGDVVGVYYTEFVTQ